MLDPRMEKLAGVIVDYSLDLQPGEKTLIECFDVPEEFTAHLVGRIRLKGAQPFPSIRQNRVLRELYGGAEAEHMKLLGEIELERMRRMDAYVGVRGGANASEMAGVPSERMELVNAHYFKPVHLEHRVNRCKWVVLRWPSPAMAQMAGMSTIDFEDFFFRVCTLDYSRLSRAMDPLVERLEKTSRVRIAGPGTDLSFSIAGLPAVKCDGHRNLPDGEVFTAPVRDSVNGVIHYNTPTIYQGVSFDNIRLEFREGKIVDAQGAGREQTRRLNAIFDSDEGARHVGEFSIALNPHITRPMKDILFDEKIGGSIHFTPGNAYERADNGNRSRIHWDLVLIQTEEFGGGELYFDDEIVRADGRFVTPDLEPLNPENLVNEG